MDVGSEGVLFLVKRVVEQRLKEVRVDAFSGFAVMFRSFFFLRDEGLGGCCREQGRICWLSGQQVLGWCGFLAFVSDRGLRCFDFSGVEVVFGLGAYRGCGVGGQGCFGLQFVWGRVVAGGVGFFVFCFGSCLQFVFQFASGLDIIF